MSGYSDSEIVLLLTATVTSQWTHMNNMIAPNDRLQQYVNAIQWYLDQTPFRIVVGENSGYYQLKEHFAPDDQERIELICYQETNTTRTYGYNEMLILRHIYEESKFIDKSTLILKVTGRLIVKNINSHVRQLRRSKGDFIAAYIHRSLVYIDSRFFAFTSSMFAHILSYEDACCAIFWEDVHAGKVKNGEGGKYVDFESTIGAAIRDALRRDKKSFRFLFHPRIISGVEGYYGTVYNDGLWFQLKARVKSALWYLDYHLFVKPRL